MTFNPSTARSTSRVILHNLLSIASSSCTSRPFTLLLRLNISNLFPPILLFPLTPPSLLFCLVHYFSFSCVHSTSGLNPVSLQTHLGSRSANTGESYSSLHMNNGVRVLTPQREVEKSSFWVYNFHPQQTYIYCQALKIVNNWSSFRVLGDKRDQKVRRHLEQRSILSF